MKIDGNSIRVGNVIEHKDRLWRVVKTQHVKPGKGGAFLQTEMKDIRSGTKLNERFRSSETVERVRLEQRDHQFLFGTGEDFTFMDVESFDQVSISLEMIGEDDARYLDEGMIVNIESYEGDVIGMSLPDTVVLEIAEADAVVKGQTASSSYKPAVLSNGVRTSVPPYIESGTKVVINTVDGSYLERVKG